MQDRQRSLDIYELIRIPHQLGGKNVPRNTVLGCKECKQNQDSMDHQEFFSYWSQKSAPVRDDLNQVWGTVDRWWKSQPEEI